MKTGAPSDDRLRAALARRSERSLPTAACPEPGVLWDLAAGALEPSQARETAAHAVTCGACREALRLAREAGATGAGRSRVAKPAGWQSARWFAAAAAVMVIGVGLFLVVGRRDHPKPPEFRDEPGVRIDAVQPREPTRDGKTTLAWTTVEGARYDLTLAREDLEVLSIVRGLERPGYTLPASLAAKLRPGERLIWQVEAVFPDGRRIRSGTFSLRVE